jgi:hypothetical protein
MMMGSFFPIIVFVSKAAGLPGARANALRANYFSVIGIQFIIGTTVREGSDQSFPAEVVVSESLAMQYFPQTTHRSHSKA